MPNGSSSQAYTRPTLDWMTFSTFFTLSLIMTPFAVQNSGALLSESHGNPRANKTDAGNGSEAICRVSNVLRSPSPDPRRSPNIAEPHV